MSVQTVVKELRAAGLSDAEIAAPIGCAVSTISMWANGERAIRTGDYMMKLFRLHQEKTQPPALIRRARTPRRAKIIAS